MTRLRAAASEHRTYDVSFPAVMPSGRLSQPDGGMVIDDQNRQRCRLSVSCHCETSQSQCLGGAQDCSAELHALSVSVCTVTDISGAKLHKLIDYLRTCLPP